MIEAKVTYTLEHDGHFYLVENVPARISAETGEQFFHQKLWSAFSLSFFKIRSPKKWSKRPFLSLPFEGFHGILALLSAHREGIMLRKNH